MVQPKPRRFSLAASLRQRNRRCRLEHRKQLNCAANWNRGQETLPRRRQHSDCCRHGRMIVELVLACENNISAAAGGGFCGRSGALNPCDFALLAMAAGFGGSHGRCVSRISSARGRCVLAIDWAGARSSAPLPHRHWVGRRDPSPSQPLPPSPSLSPTPTLLPATPNPALCD
jgi:hypothetical protein